MRDRFTHIRLSRETKKNLEKIKRKRYDGSLDKTVRRMIRFSEGRNINSEMKYKSMDLEELLRAYYPEELADSVGLIRVIAECINEDPPKKRYDGILIEIKATMLDMLERVLNTKTKQTKIDTINISEDGMIETKQPEGKPVEK